MKEFRKIISAEQTRAVDQYTIQNEPISSLNLMERASKSFVDAIEGYLKSSDTIAVVCGTGNNGGDGLAIARILEWKGYEVQAYLYQFSNRLSEDCKANFEKLESTIVVEKDSQSIDFTKFDIVIDGLFGSGLSRKIEGWIGHVIDDINNCDARIFSIDIPSGMFCDKQPLGDHIIQSEIVVSFQRPKLSFFIPESCMYIKEWIVTDIGLDEAHIQGLDSDNFMIDESVKQLLKNRKRYSHKGSYGHSLIIAGSRGKMGAAVLCAGGCLRSGVGLLTMHVPACGLVIMQISRPEAMCSIDINSYHFSTLPEVELYQSIAIGPGIGTSKETAVALKQLMHISKVPLIIDADALNIISQDKELYHQIPKDSVLTPHPKEFERLVGKWDSTMERLEKQREFSKAHKCVIVLKDANTTITDQMGNAFFNSTGNPGMATGGSGDVLTGIIAGLIAQGYSTIHASILGVYFHGLAGDAVRSQKGMNACIASDLVEALRIE